MSSSIGSESFLNMTIPTGPQEQVVLEGRAGVAGFTAWLTGKQGVPSTLRTFRDCVSFADAVARMQTYETFPRLGPLPVVYGGITLPFALKILEVKPITVKKIAGGTGGLMGNAQAILVAQWQVVSWVS